jgi:hypothetical protein
VGAGGRREKDLATREVLAETVTGRINAAVLRPERTRIATAANRTRAAALNRPIVVRAISPLSTMPRFVI